MCTPNSNRVSSAFRTTFSREVPVFIRYPVGATGSRPVVLFEHGGGLGPLSGRTDVCWSRALARAGYIVVHPYHAETASTELASALCAAHNIPQANCNGTDVNFMTLLRAHDERAVLDDLPCVESTFQTRSGSSARMDLSRIAGGAWSAGTAGLMVLNGGKLAVGATSQTVSLPDTRMLAMMINSPSPATEFGLYCTLASPDCCIPGAANTCANWESQSSWADIQIPTLIHSGDGDCSGGSKNGPMRRVIFSGLGSSAKSMIYLDHAGCDTTYNPFSCGGCRFSHETFDLYGNEVCNADGTLIQPAPGNTTEQLRHAQARLLISSALAFYDAHIRQRPAAQLYLQSDKLQVLALDTIDWPGDSSLNGACAINNLSACEYSPEETFPVGEVGNPDQLGSYIVVPGTAY